MTLIRYNRHSQLSENGEFHGIIRVAKIIINIKCTKKIMKLYIKS